MGALIPSVYTDYSAIRFNGVDKYAYIPNPSFRTDTAGAISFWFRIKELRTTNGASTLVALADSGPLVGMFGRFMIFSFRRNGGYGNTNNYFDITFSSNGSIASAKSGTTALSANTWCNAVTGSDGKIYLNSAEESYQYWRPDQFTSGWFGDIGASNMDLGIGARRMAGNGDNHANADINDIIYLPGRVFTPAEVSEIYSKGMGADPRLMSFGGASGLMAWDLEKRLTPVVGSLSNTFTGVNIVPADYITP